MRGSSNRRFGIKLASYNRREKNPAFGWAKIRESQAVSVKFKNRTIDNLLSKITFDPLVFYLGKRIVEWIGKNQIGKDSNIAFKAYF